MTVIRDRRQFNQLRDCNRGKQTDINKTTVRVNTVGNKGKREFFFKQYIAFGRLWCPTMIID